MVEIFRKKCEYATERHFMFEFSVYPKAIDFLTYCRAKEGHCSGLVELYAPVRITSLTLRPPFQG